MPFAWIKVFARLAASGAGFSSPLLLASIVVVGDRHRGSREGACGRTVSCETVQLNRDVYEAPCERAAAARTSRERQAFLLLFVRIGTIFNFSTIFNHTGILFLDQILFIWPEFLQLPTVALNHLFGQKWCMMARWKRRGASDEHTSKNELHRPRCSRVMAI